MAQIQIKDASGTSQLVAKVDNTGQTTRTNSMPVVLSSEDIRQLAPGSSGVVITTNTSVVNGSFQAIQLLEDTVFSSFVETGATGQAMTGFVISAGNVLYGQITSYTLTSGKVRAYSA